MTSIRQSDLAAFARCAHQVKLNSVVAQRGERERTLSATVFGTVMHHAAQVMEELHHAGEPDACERAVRTFEHYWHPDHIDAIEPGGIDVFLPRQTWAGLTIRGRDNLRAYYQHLLHDNGMLLATEHTFAVPITLLISRSQPKGFAFSANQSAPEEHTLTGTVDRLALRKDSRGKAHLSVEDFKTGAKPTYLRHALQWTVYAYASLEPGFWDAWPDDDLARIRESLHRRGFTLYRDDSGLPIIPRRGRWIALRDSFGVHDAGWRTPADFERMKVALAQYIRATQADVYPLSISGQVCTYCPFLYSGDCGGVPFDKSDEGVPYPG